MLGSQANVLELFFPIWCLAKSITQISTSFTWENQCTESFAMVGLDVILNLMTQSYAPEAAKIVCSLDTLRS